MKHELSHWEKFSRKMKNLDPGVQFVYFTGEDLSFTRSWREDIDRAARFCRAVYDLGYGQLFKRRSRENPREFEYIVVLHERLGMRQDGNGRFQEAERVAGY